MTKRYNEAIKVEPDGPGGFPVAFSWRGRRYYVDQMIGSWRESGEWWNARRSSGTWNGTSSNGHRDREYFRLLAHRAGTSADGDLDADGFLVQRGAVYDLYLDRTKGEWHLAKVWD